MARNITKRTRQRRAEGAAGFLPTIITVLAILACLGAGAAYTWFRFAVEVPPILRTDTLCPEDGPRAITIVLIDASDALPSLARTQLVTFLQDVVNGLPPYALFELRVLDPATEGGQIIFAKCNPGNGSNLSQITANPAYVRKRWNEGFRQPLQAALDSGSAPAAAKSSPIMETIQQIAVQRFDGAKVANLPKHLILISDMIQNSKTYSQYKQPSTFAAYKNSPASKALWTNLHSADVTIRYILRDTIKINTGQHLEFWLNWFLSSGAKTVDSEKMQGVG